MSHSGSFVESFGLRCQVDGPVVAIDGLLTWQEFESTLAAVVGAPVALAEARVTTEHDDRLGTFVTYGRLTDGSASLLRRALCLRRGGRGTPGV